MIASKPLVTTAGERKIRLFSPALGKTDPPAARSVTTDEAQDNPGQPKTTQDKNGELLRKPSICFSIFVVFYTGGKARIRPALACLRLLA
ncbi:MAG: hypothetical protein EA001_03880 [Oscillatoriales cyanobacterium]|nr:MAG: hypothetical protein EA001_03880 [Oscillatoriales cyanobacterium]